MPVIRTRSRFSPEVRGELVSTLAAELARNDASGNGEPLVFEDPLDPTEQLFVVVVWSRWADVPWAERSRIIVEAYECLDREHPDASPRTPTIGVTNGLTWDEADANAYFKFSIQPMARSGEADPGAIRAAMVEEGGFMTDYGVGLRFMLRSESEAVYQRLLHKLPEAQWGLTQLVRFDTPRTLAS